MTDLMLDPSDLEDAVCIACGCTDEAPCVPIICAWRKVSRTTGLGLCTRCDSPGNLTTYRRRVRAAQREAMAHG